MKCASTWLAECLRSHPQVLVSTPKELHFFDWPDNLARGDEWYFGHFRGAASYRAAGEICAHYLTEAISVPHMRRVLGPVQVLVTLRHPVDRFLSEYKHRMRSGQLPKRQFQRLSRSTLAKALSQCPQLKLNSLYAERLEEFANHFSWHEMFVALKDDIDSAPRDTLERLFGFLGVDNSFIPPVSDKPVSPGIVPRSVLLEQIRQQVYGLARAHSPQVINWVRRWRLAEVYRRLNAMPSETALRIDPDVSRHLFDMFARDIEATSRIIGRDLSSWLEAPPLQNRAA
jgi:hypothetical protein